MAPEDSPLRNIPSKWLLLAILLLLSIPAPTPSQDKIDRKKVAIEWITKAESLVNLQAPGSSAYRLRARVRVFVESRRAADGIYEVHWASPKQWSEQIDFPGYHELLIASENKLWRKRNLNYRPIRMEQLRFLMGFWKRLSLDDLQRVKSIPAKVFNGQAAECFELTRSRLGKREICVDPTTLDVLQISIEGFYNKSTYALSDYQLTGTRRFPHELKFTDEGIPAVEVSIEDFRLETVPPILDMASVSNLEPWDWCDTASPVKQVSDIPFSEYPRSEKWWVVTVYGVVDKDGKMKEITAVKSSHRHLDPLHIKLISKLRFKPAACQGVPIKSEYFLTFGTMDSR